MVDLQESEAVPPFDPRGDERAGYFIAGGLLVVLGWGVAVVLNIVLHAAAPVGGHWILDLWFGRSWGAYAWGTVLFGAGTGTMGVVLLALGRAAPRGPVVLPGVEY